LGDLDWLRLLVLPRVAREGMHMKMISRVGLLAVMGSLVASTVMAGVGVVDMERLIKLHPRTRTDGAILQQYVTDFDDEREEMMKALQARGEEFDELRKSIEDVGLSEKAIEEKRALAKAKLEELRELEGKLRETAQTRQKELTSQELRMRQRVVADISEIVSEVAKDRKLDVVLDATGVGIGGYAPVIFYKDKVDITDAVIGKMPKTEEE
jgi:Skp family chaperone for outer membrane proteins